MAARNRDRTLALGLEPVRGRNGHRTTRTLALIALNKIGESRLGDFSTIVPGGTDQAVLTDSQTRVIQQPQVRAVEKFRRHR